MKDLNLISTKTKLVILRNEKATGIRVHVSVFTKTVHIGKNVV